MVAVGATARSPLGAMPGKVLEQLNSLVVGEIGEERRTERVGGLAFDSPSTRQPLRRMTRRTAPPGPRSADGGHEGRLLDTVVLEFAQVGRRVAHPGYTQ
jgi:hypothetical protein